MLATKSLKLFYTLVASISSHMAYVRGLAQYFCFEFYKHHRMMVNEKERQFLDELSTYSVGNKDSRKLMKNIEKGIDSFTNSVRNLDMRSIVTINFNKV